jgi:hypothetical protein
LIGGFEQGASGSLVDPEARPDPKKLAAHWTYLVNSAQRVPGGMIFDLVAPHPAE